MSHITLTHPFVNQLPNVDEFFSYKNESGHITTINNLCHQINKLSEQYASQIDSNMFKGNALELFTEFMIKDCGSDNRIGIFDYSPATDIESDDVGVDGFGIGANGKTATVQVKFRAGDFILRANEDHLSNFLTSSWVDHGVDIEDNKNMLIVTTGLKVDESTMEKMLKNKVRVLNRDSLRQMYDNRPEWWARFWDAVKASRTNIEETKPLVLRKHQKEAVEAILKDDDGKGKVILPTGTGKTNIQAEIVRWEIESLMAKGIVPLIKVNSSRILLCFQLFEDYYKYFAPYHLDARYVNFNSGNSDEKYFAKEMRKHGGIFRSILSTTSAKKLASLYEVCKKEHVPLIVFSTYHSSHRFQDKDSGFLIKPNLTIHDEAHNLVSREFGVAAQLPTDKQYFFTATVKVTDSDKDLGFSNETIFSNLIYSRSAANMIKDGEMVPPYMHIVRAKNATIVDVEKVEADYKGLFFSIVDAFINHEKKIKEMCCDGHKENVGAKVLVVCRSQQDLINMLGKESKTKILEEFRMSYPDIHIMALSSEYGLRIDDEYVEPPVTNSKKYKLLKKMKSLPSKERCIIFHVDMIGEGIDVPGITGVMPFRNCEISKFVQNIGRSSRLNKLDRDKLYKNEISTEDRTKWIKPCSWVIVPSFMANSEGFVDRFNRILWDLKNEFGFIPTEHVHIDNNSGNDEDEPPTPDNLKGDKKKSSDSGINGNISHDFEEVSFITLLEQVIFEHKCSDSISQSKDERITEISELVSSSQTINEFNEYIVNIGINNNF